MSKKRLGFFMATLAIFAIGSILLAACTRPGTVSSSTSNNGNTTGSGGGGTTVHMGNTNFLVSSISIPKGAKLTLVDAAAVVHIIKNGSWVNGNQQLKQETGAPTVNQNFNGSDTHDIGPFTTAGTFHIFCTVHANMNLTITVK